MAKNREFAEGKVLSLPVLAGSVAGGPVRVGGINGVCLTTRDAAGNATVQTDGVFNLPVTGTTTIGGIVYISTTNALGVTAGTNQIFGHALDVATNGVVRVRIAQFAPALAV